MAYTISDAKNDLEGILKGTTTNKVRNLYGVFDRAARDILLDADPRETKRTAQIAGAVYDGVYDYTAPADLKGDKVIDVRPQFGRAEAELFGKRYSTDFDRYKGDGERKFQVTSRNGVKSIRIDDPIGGIVTLNECDSITSNGTWAASNDATSLSEDTLYKVSGSASLRFDVSGVGTTATLSNSTMDSVDLSAHEDVATVFAWMWFPDASKVTNVILRWGTDASNYWTKTVTSQFSGAFQDGWNLLGFDWDSATETGTGDSSDVKYLLATITYDGTADTDFRLDSVVSSTGRILDIEYYSKYLFSSSAGTWKERVTDDSDVVNLDVESYPLFLSKAAELCAQQIETSKDDTAWFKTEYRSALKRYKGTSRSESAKARTLYYRV